MRKFLLFAAASFVASPVYGIGFWMEAGAGGGRFSHGDLTVKAESDGSTSEATYDYSGSAALFGGSFSGGVGFAPIPVLVGLGVSYAMGSGSSKVTVGDMEITSDWDLSRTIVKVPLAYRLKLPTFQVLLGVEPGFYSANFKDKNTDSTDTFSGLSFGLFGREYFMLGSLGVGGGVSLNFVPSLTKKDEITAGGNTIKVYSTLKGNTDISLNLRIFYGIFYITGLLD